MKRNTLVLLVCIVLVEANAVSSGTTRNKGLDVKGGRCFCGG